MRLQGKKIAFLLDEGFEDLEFWVTVMRLREEGAQVIIMSHDGPQEYHGKNALTAKSEVSVKDVKAADFDAVVVPGGWAPDKMRRYDDDQALRQRHLRRGQDRRVDLPRGTRRHFGGRRQRPQGHGQPGHQRRSRQRGRDVGGRSRRSAMATSCGGASSPTFPISAASWWRRSKSRR